MQGIQGGKTILATQVERVFHDSGTGLNPSVDSTKVRLVESGLLPLFVEDGLGQNLEPDEPA